MQDNATLLRKSGASGGGGSIQFRSVQNQVVWRAAILQALGGWGRRGPDGVNAGGRGSTSP